MVTRPYYDDESEPEAATPEPAPEVETALREGLLQGTEPPPESYPVKPETATDLERYQAMHSKQPFATQEFVPGLDQAQGNLRSALDMAAQIQPPPYRPIPTRPPPEPGFKGALKDALRGMIPGYVQGQEAALKERQLEAAAQNKYEMELYKQQLGLVKPMLQKDYETQAWMQKVTMTEAYLRKTFPWMTEAEIAARSTGHNYTTPRQPGAGIPKTFHFPPGIVPGDKLVAVMNEKGQWMAPGGAAIPPQILNKAIDVGSGDGNPPPPHYFWGQEEGAPEGTNASLYYATRDKPGQPQRVPGVERAPSPIDEWTKTMRTQQQQIAQERLTLAKRAELERLTKAYDTDDTNKRFRDLMPLMDVLNADMTLPANHTRLVAVFARLNDPRTGVMKAERDEIRDGSDSVIRQFGHDVYRAAMGGGLLTDQAVENIKKAIVGQVKLERQIYDDHRRETIKDIEKKTGLKYGDGFILKDDRTPFETQNKQRQQVIDPRTGQPIWVRERPDGRIEQVRE